MKFLNYHSLGLSLLSIMLTTPLFAANNALPETPSAPPAIELPHARPQLNPTTTTNDPTTTSNKEISTSAESPSIPHSNLPSAPTLSTPPAPPQLTGSSSILVDADSGHILAENNSQMRVEPASLTKMLTLYIISDALKRGQIHLTDMVPISEKAWRTGGSRMFVKVGDKVSVMDLINGIIITSGNDSCVAMAEYIAGSEEAFANLMNQYAQHLRMTHSHFMNSDGMPDPQHYTTAADLAILGRALINHFPEYYPWYKQKTYKFNNIEQYNRNKLLWTDPTVDGIKTGHTESAGYCLVASAKRNNMRLISVVMNTPGMSQRAADSEALLTYGFRFFNTYKLFSANQDLAKARVWSGKDKYVTVGLNRDLYVTIPANQYRGLSAKVELTPAIKAPIKHGAPLGNVIVKLNNQPLKTIPLIALQDAPKGGIFTRMTDSIALKFHQWMGKKNA